MATMNLLSEIKSVDSIPCLKLAIKELFPNAILPEINEEISFPVAEDRFKIEIEDIDYSYFFEKIHTDRIADTALDCMSQNIENDYAEFKISRQAALAGKIAFVLQNETPLGGVFELTLHSLNLCAWIEEKTWHKGREAIPREINDELKMRNDGVPQDWF